MLADNESYLCSTASQVIWNKLITCFWWGLQNLEQNSSPTLSLSLSLPPRSLFQANLDPVPVSWDFGTEYFLTLLSLPSSCLESISSSSLLHCTGISSWDGWPSLERWSWPTDGEGDWSTSGFFSAFFQDFPLWWSSLDSWVWSLSSFNQACKWMVKKQSKHALTKR